MVSEREKLRQKVVSRGRYIIDKEIREKGVIEWLRQNVNVLDDDSVIHDKEFLKKYFDLEKMI